MAKENENQVIQTSIRILLIEDDPEDAIFMRDILFKETDPLFVITETRTLQEGIEILNKEGRDLVLLDLYLPDSAGLETFETIRRVAPEVPVVIYSGMGERQATVDAVRSGAQDYLVKGEFDRHLVARVILYAIERQRMRLVLEGLSMVDELTGLYNRRGFTSLTEAQIKLSSRSRKGWLLVMADMDKLKDINDRKGHAEGDRALAMTAKLLKRAFRGSDILARIGGDEFAILAIDAQVAHMSALRSRIEFILTEHNAKHRWQE